MFQANISLIFLILPTNVSLSWFLWDFCAIHMNIWYKSIIFILKNICGVWIQKYSTYVISQPLKTIIRAEFLDFDIEGSQNCNYDYLEVRDGPDANSSFIGKFCGDPTMTPSPIVSTLNYLWFSFTTDASVTNRGFKVYLIQLKKSN